MTFNMEALKLECRKLGLELSDLQLNQFFTYYDFLTEKNKVMNLTAITEMNDVIYKHFIDSLCIVKAVDFTKVNSLIDIGTGAGFPGVPIKIVFPDIQIVLMDSLKKRVGFLDELTEMLGLSNIRSVHGRAEDMGRVATHRDHYDLCVSRAVANLSTLSEYCLPMVKPGGYFVSYKSGHVQEEVEQALHGISLLGGKLDEVIPFALPGQEDKRSLVKIKKEKKTPLKYPRKAGIPSKEPLV